MVESEGGTIGMASEELPNLYSEPKRQHGSHKITNISFNIDPSPNTAPLFPVVEGPILEKPSAISLVVQSFLKSSTFSECEKP